MHPVNSDAANCILTLRRQSNSGSTVRDWPSWLNDDADASAFSVSMCCQRLAHDPLKRLLGRAASYISKYKLLLLLLCLLSLVLLVPWLLMVLLLFTERSDNVFLVIVSLNFDPVLFISYPW